MKRTKIKYRKKGKNIEILDIENVATIEEIEKEFGVKVSNQYFSEHPNYSQIEEFISINFIGDYNSHMYKIPIMQSKENFQEMIEQMKAAGKRLCEIKNKIEQSEIYEVLI